MPEHFFINIRYLSYVETNIEHFFSVYKTAHLFKITDSFNDRDIQEELFACIHNRKITQMFVRAEVQSPEMFISLRTSSNTA